MFFFLGFLFSIFVILPFVLRLVWKMTILIAAIAVVVYVHANSPEFVQTHFTWFFVLALFPITYFYILHKYADKEKGNTKK
jgi:hypothetical protein